MNLFRQYARQLEELTQGLTEQLASVRKRGRQSGANEVGEDHGAHHTPAATHRPDTTWALRAPISNTDIPTGSPVTGLASSAFGSRIHPTLGVRRQHNGEDIAAAAGTPVSATAGGVVTYAGHRGSYGNLVEIDHGNGIVTRYAHLQSVAVAAGTRIENGATIGAVGSTGRSTGPHLHYEVVRDGRFENPRHYMRTP